MNRSLFLFIVINLFFLNITIAQRWSTSWQSIFPSPTGNDLYDVHAFSGNDLIAIGDGQTLVRSSDGGITWRAKIKIANGYGGLKAMSFLNNSVGIAVGNFGSVLRTTNGGIDWSKYNAGTSINLNGVSFRQDNVVFAVGEMGEMRKSTDGGKNWSLKTSGTSQHLNEIAFRDNLFGISCGDSNTVLRTTDGGTSWTKLSIGAPADERWRKVLFVNHDSVVIVLGGGGIIYSTDGNSWTGVDITNIIDPPSYSMVRRGLSIAAISVDTFMIGSGLSGSHYVFRTTDRGVNWNWFDFGKDVSLFGMTYLNATTAVAVGSGGALYRSTDAGATWNDQSEGGGDQYYGIDFLTGLKGIAVGTNGRIIKTTDGGENWINLPPGSPAHPWATADNGAYHSYSTVKYLNDTTVAVAGALGAFSVTTDGGGSWHNNMWNTYASEINDMIFLDVNTVLAVGAEGSYPDVTTRIIRSTDMGANWSEVYQPYKNIHGRFYDIYFTDALNGYIVGDTGDYPVFGSLFLKTTDGGNSWVDFTSGIPGNGSMKSVYFQNASIGWISGMTGMYPNAVPTIFKTTDGGVSWSSLLFVTTRNAAFNHIEFINATEGIACGYSRRDPIQSSIVDVPAGIPTLFYTTNGGASWIEQNISASYFKNMQFVQRNGTTLGYAVGAGIFCSVVLPMNVKYWVGNEDSSWLNPNNWEPVGVPSKIDSVVIQTAGTNPVIDLPLDQVLIGALYIRGGGRLHINGGVSTITVKGDVTVNGTLKVIDGGTPNFIVGGNWKGNKVSMASLTAIDEGFLPARSRVLLNGVGKVFGTFYDVAVDTGGEIESSGNMYVNNSIGIIQKLTLRAEDTLFIQNDAEQSIVGEGVIVNGTIKRRIKPVPAEPYRFESEYTSMTFNELSALPTAVSVSCKSGMIPRAFSLKWKPVLSSTLDATNHALSDEGVFPKSKWTFGIPKVSAKNNGSFMAEGVPRVARMYSVTYDDVMSVSSALSFHYDVEDLDNPAVEDSLVLLTGPYIAKQVRGKWNLVSLPLEMEQSAKDSLFPTAVSAAFEFENGYAQASSLANGKGYWMRFSTDQEIEMKGFDKETIAIPVTTGWNLIGGISYDVDVDAITSVPSNIIASQFFSYNNGYETASMLSPMSGFWMKANAPGTLYLDAAANIPKRHFTTLAQKIAQDYSQLVVGDASGSKQTLLYGTSKEENNLQIFELPPPPPAGIFDARFQDNEMIADVRASGVVRKGIRLSSEIYPVTISWNEVETGIHAALLIDNKRIVMNGKGAYELNEFKHVMLELSRDANAAVPSEFALFKNFPNPFNPTTAIRFHLPVHSVVTLTVYDMLGKVAKKLVDNKEMEPGEYTEYMEATNFASGIYFYKLEAAEVANPANNFQSVQKAVLIK